MINITVWADRSLEIDSEFPENGCSVTLHSTGAAGGAPALTRFTLYLTLEQWWKLRTAIPKAEGYRLHQMEDKAPSISDHAEADKWAEQFYLANRTKEGAL